MGLNRARRAAMVVALVASGCGASSEACQANTDTWDNFAHGFFTSNCAACHPNTFNTPAAVASNLTEIESEISRGSMPRGATLAATDKTRILSWLSCQ